MTTQQEVQLDEIVKRSPLQASFSCGEGTSAKWVSVTPKDFAWLVAAASFGAKSRGFVEEQACECAHEETCWRCGLLGQFMGAPIDG